MSDRQKPQNTRDEPVAVLDGDPVVGQHLVERVREHVVTEGRRQSGTAMPTRYVVTSPPTSSSARVHTASSHAERRVQGLLGW